MTDRPVAADRTAHDVRHVRGWFALATVGVLLLSLVAGPWAADSGAQSGPVATPDTPSVSLIQTGPTPGTPRAPLVIRSSSSTQIISRNGTPQATATLPTEPRQGTPVPLAPLYMTTNGSAMVPESTTGYELRLYRLTIAPGSTFDLPESSGWTLLGASGTVDLFRTTFGTRSEDSFSMSSGSSTSGLQAGTFQNLSDDNAVVWAIELAIGGAPVPASADGAAFDLLGQTPLAGLTVGATVHIAFVFDAAGPVGRPLDAINEVTQPYVTGSVPAGFVVGLQGTISITGPAGTDPITVGAGQSVTIPGLTGRSIAGPAQNATDAPNAYVAVSAQEQEPRPALTGTPGVPLPIATVLPATPILAGSPAAGHLVTCDAEPRTVEELQAAIDQLYATPSLITDPFGRSARAQAGTGTPADDATVAAVEATLREYFVCSANGDLARTFGLNSDEYLAFILGYIVSDPAQLTEYATALPVSTGVPPELVLSDVEIFADGRVGALVYSAGGTTYATFVLAEDGTWLVDVADLEAGMIAPLPGGIDGTPGV